MDLHLQAATSTGGGTNSTGGKPDEAAASSDFSRLLARHVGPSGERVTREDLPDVSDRKSEADQTNGKDHTAVEHEGRPDMRSDDGPAQDTRRVPEIEATRASFTETGGSFAEASLSLASMPGFLAMVDSTGSLSFADPAAMALEAVPAEVRARLAGDIAAGFTNRQGVQTLSLNLEPEHLGKVDVRMRAEGDRLSVRILAANREAETALRDNVKDLTDAIRDRTGKFQQVEVRIELKSEDGKNAGGSARDKSGEDSPQQDKDGRQGDAQPQDEHGGQEFAEEKTVSRHGKQGG